MTNFVTASRESVQGNDDNTWSEHLSLNDLLILRSDT